VNARTQPPAGMPPEDLTAFRLERIEDALSTMAESMNSLVALEQKHAETREGLGRAFKATEDVEQRVRSLELDMVAVKQSRGWTGQAITIIATAFLTEIAASLIPHIMK
jgi:hypothetical protein